MAEDYVRPPLLAREPASRRATRWRFRALLVLLLLVTAAVVVLVVRALVGTGEGNPGVGTGQAAGYGRVVPDTALSSTIAAVPAGRPGTG
jgi:hypothetical protein